MFSCTPTDGKQIALRKILQPMVSLEGLHREGIMGLFGSVCRAKDTRSNRGPGVYVGLDYNVVQDL